MARSVLCTSCGHRHDVADDFDRRKVRCPECGVMGPVDSAPIPTSRPPKSDDEEVARLLAEVDEMKPAARPARQPALPPAPKSTRPSKRSAPAPSDDDDEDSPYAVVGGEDRPCPKCGRAMTEDSVVCIGCGHDLRKGKKHKRTYAPMHREWDLGISFAARVKLFAGLTVLGQTLGFVSAIVAGEWLVVVAPLQVFTLLLAFLLGTFFHVELTRDPRGRVTLTRQWRWFFVPRPIEEIDVAEYEGVRVGHERDAGFFEWLICLDLMLYGIVAGVAFYLIVMNRDRHTVVLTKDHGYGDVILYRGDDLDLAQEAAAALRDAGRLREETS